MQVPMTRKHRSVRANRASLVVSGALLGFGVAALSATVASGSDFLALAAIDGGSADETRVIDFIAERVGGESRRGANGSLLIEFGSGSPRTLFVTGVDEPALVVSGIHAEGYIHVRPHAEVPFGKRLAERFLGQHVNVSTRAGQLVAGVVAAPSVHFGSSGRRRVQSSESLFVDIGASDVEDVASAGVEILNRVTLAKRAAFISEDWLASPWISSRVGAQILIDLAAHLRGVELQGTVILAFVTQQYPSNAGLARALHSVRPDRVILLAPNGDSVSSVSPLGSTDSSLVGQIGRLADSAGFKLKRSGTHRPSFGPFSGGEIWDSEQEGAAIKPAVRNGATPAEAVRVGEVSALSALLATLVGAETVAETLGERPAVRKSAAAEPPDSMEDMVRRLVEIAGVSGKEDPVREELLRLVPTALADRARTDELGNMIVRIGSNGDPLAMFLAHMDEIGRVVTSVLPSGAVRTASRGGGNHDLYFWQAVSVHGSQGGLPAVMTRSGTIDFGETSDAEIDALGVRVGDAVTVPKRYRALLGKRVAGRSLDDRLGCAVLLEAMRRLEKPARRARRAIEFVFTVQEETGLKGARHVARQSNPKVVYAVDTFVTSDTPLEPRDFAFARLGAGPVLRALDQSGATPQNEVGRILALAKRRGIPVQVGVTAGGNDGSTFVSLDTVNVPIGFPLRYAHTPIETADLRDAESAVDLIEALALDAMDIR